MSQKQKARANPAMAAAVFMALLSATAAPPEAPVAVRGVPVVQQQTVQTEKPATNSQAPANAQTLGQMDRPRRLHYTRRNPFRQVRRRMERMGFDLTGRQWRKLLQAARRGGFDVTEEAAA